MKTRCIILDDEPLARDVVKSYLGKLGNFEIVAECTDAMKAMQILRLHKIDLMFMDIQMPHISGLDFLKILKNSPKVIITSGFSEYAINGFEFDVVDYLLKPFTIGRFMKAIEKFYNEVDGEKHTDEIIRQEVQSGDSFIYVKENKRVVKIDISKIVFIEGLSEYVQIFTDQKKIVTKTSLTNLVEKLPAQNFIRIHKSYIVPLSRVEAFTANSIGVPGKQLPIGRNYKNSVLNALQVHEHS